MDSKLIKYDKQHIWHPFTQMKDWVNDDPASVVVIEKGRGNYLYDVNGKKYLDGFSSIWVNLHGHNNKRLNNALKKQISKIAHSSFLGLTHEPAILLAHELLKVAPKNLKKVFYSDNGSTAVEVALKMAYQYHKQLGKEKRLFLSLKNAYHGDTLGAVSVGGVDLFHGAFKKLLFKTVFAMSPYCFRCQYKVRSTEYGKVNTFTEHCRLNGCNGECVKQIEDILKKNHKNIAGCIVEPMVQAAGGIVTLPPGYLKEFDRIRRKYGVLLICDEVATGFGRTGTMFAVEHDNVTPDLMCLSKGITGGYMPLAVTLATDNIYKAFLGRYEKFKTFFHGHSYTANPLACALAIENLKIFKDENIVNGIQDKINYLKSELNNLDNSHIADVRQAGFIVGIELLKDKEKMLDFEPKLKIGAKVCAECRNNGLMTRPLGNTIVLFLPLSIEKSEISKIVNIINRSLLKILGK